MQRRLRIFAALCAASLALTCAVAGEPRGEGTRAFIARPVFGAAVFHLPVTVRWRSTTVGGTHKVWLNAEVNAQWVFANIQTLSAKALDRNAPCRDAVKVRSATARLTGARTLTYDLGFRFVKRVCAGSLPVELPADVECASRITLAATRSIISVDVAGALTPPCRIAGAYTSVSEAILAMVGVDVFKRHRIDLAKILPREFQGVTVDIGALAFDLPPAAPVLRIAGESTMSQAQFAAFMARLDAAPAATN